MCKSSFTVQKKFMKLTPGIIFTELWHSLECEFCFGFHQVVMQMLVKPNETTSCKHAKKIQNSNLLGMIACQMLEKHSFKAHKLIGKNRFKQD